MYQNKNAKSPADRSSLIANMAQETYLDYIGKEAAERVGYGKQLKGVVHELMIRDSKNMSPQALLNGEVTKLTDSTTARTVDLVTMKSGNVVERIQAKDVVSSSGIRDVHQRVSANQYRSAQLVGTTETTELYKQGSAGKSMKSSGISSQKTTRVADNAGAKVPNKDLVSSNFNDIGNQAKGAAAMGAVLGVVGESVTSYSEYSSGQIDGYEYAGRIVYTGVEQAAISATKTATALALKEGGKALAKSVGNNGLKRLVGSNPATAVAFGVVEFGTDMIQYASGNINGDELGSRAVGTVGSTGGAVAGAAAGAAMGSVVPVVGTAIGALLGGILGGMGGGIGGKSLGDWLFG